jgi:hypothetical protein
MSIKTNAEIIRDETTPGANTATRIGGNLVEIADDLLLKQSEITANTAKTGITPNQSSDIILNTSKVGYTESLVTANASVVANSSKVGYTEALVNANATVVANAAALLLKTDKGGFTGTSKDLENLIIAASTGASGVSIVPTSPAPAGTGIASFTATQAGTYTNYGGVVVAANSFAVISRSAAGVFSVSQTALDLTTYSKIVDTDKIKANADAALDSVSIEVVKFSESVGNYMQQDGNFGNHVNSKVIRIPVIAGKKYKLKGQILSPAHFSNTFGAYGFFGTTATNSLVTGSLVLQASTSTQGTVPVLYDLIITAPVGANYIFITQRISVDNMVLTELINSVELKNSITTNTTDIVKNENLNTEILSGVLLPIALAGTFSGIIIQSDGNAGGNANFKVVFFPVVAGKRYRFKGRITSPAFNNSFGAYQFWAGSTTLNKIGSPTTQTSTTTQGTTVIDYDFFITAPLTALNVAFTQLIASDTMAVSEVVLPTVLNTELAKAKSDIILNNTALEKNFNALSKNIISSTSIAGQFIQLDGFWDFKTGYIISIFPVIGGQTYKIKASITSPASTNNNPIGSYAFYSNAASGDYIGGTVVTQVATVVQSTIPKVIDSFVTVPANAKFIAITQLSGTDTSVVLGLIPSAKLESDLLKAVNNNITFWGDSITAGAAPANGRYFTLILKEMLPLFNIINCGVGGESAVNIPARQGALPVYNSLNFTLPSDTSLVPVGRYDNFFYSGFFKSSYDDNSGGSMLLQGEGRDFNTVNPCFVDNIECTMSYVSESTTTTTGQYYIKRNVAGTSRVINAGTKLFTNAAKNLKQGATVLFMGTNDGWIDTADLIARYKKMVEFSGVRNNFVIIGIYGGAAKINKNLDKAAFELIEKAFSREFGLHYINLRKYAVEKGLSDAGITATQADTDAIALGFCPPSLIPDGLHPGSEFSVEIADLIYATLKNLGVV